jgi:CxxC motif-containing protein (DUF1111 family)
MISGFLVAALLSSATAYPPDDASGKALFERQWVAAPSATHVDEGLGPVFDANSCNACHAGGGAGRVTPSIGTGLLVRLGQPGGAGDPVYGSQLQTQALPNVTPEASVAIRWTVLDGRRSAALHISDPGYGALDPHTDAALRRAPSLFGVGVLASIPDSEILAMEAREHRAGMAGHAAMLSGTQHIGRWGWKATTADLKEQIALALERDMGLSTPAHPEPWGECTPAESACREETARAEGAKIEVPDASLERIETYVSSLSPPAPLDEKSRGYDVFKQTGCEGCHASLTGKNGRRVDAFTDLLLHDLGPELNDGIAEGAAASSEWRTAPLWNLGEELAAGGLLHDGRARNVAEAVRWHGGEAARARDRFRALNEADRAAMERFLMGK